MNKNVLTICFKSLTFNHCHHFTDIFTEEQSSSIESMEQPSPRKACDTTEDHGTSNGDTFNDQDALEILDSCLRYTSSTPMSNTTAPAGINMITSVPTDPVVNEIHPLNMTTNHLMNGLIDSEQHTNIQTTREPDPLFAASSTDDTSISTPNPYSETTNGDANIDNISSDILPAGEEMLSIADITYNDIQQLDDWLSTGYQTDAIPYSPANKNTNRCKRITTILISYRIYYHINYA